MFDASKLIEMAQDYLLEEAEYQQYRRTFKGGWVPSLDPSKYGRYKQLEATATAKLEYLKRTCDILGANMDSVLKVAKAVNRYEKRVRWQYCIRIDHRDTKKRLARHVCRK